MLMDARHVIPQCIVSLSELPMSVFRCDQTRQAPKRLTSGCLKDFHDVFALLVVGQLSISILEHCRKEEHMASW